MLRAYEDAMRSVAERIAEAERQARQIIGEVRGREEKYTEIFRVRIEDNLNGFSDGGVKWRVFTYTTDKQSGQETRVGADLVIAVDLELDGVRVTKGVLVQSKVNQNLRHGVSVDSVAKLRSQCRVMRSRSNAAYVFVYGEQTTKVLSASGVLTGASLSQLPSKGVGEFFGDVMMCWAGDSAIAAVDHRQLERVVKTMEGRSGVLISGRTR